MERLSAVHSAIHVEEHGGGFVRYFASPHFRATGGPDLAWHCCDDLWRLLDLTPDERVHVLRLLRRDWSAPTTLATTEGPVVVQPMFMGEGIVEACESLFQPPPGGFGRLRGALRRGCTAATKAQVPHLSGVRYLAFHLEALEVEGSGN
jgi:hypothetical protein